MKHFSISIHSMAEVQAFVDLAMAQPFKVTVGNDYQQVNGKNFMGMFSLDLHKPIEVLVDCDDEAFNTFRKQASQLFAS